MAYSHEDIETVCGALLTLEDFNKGPQQLWELFLRCALTHEKPLTAEAVYKELKLKSDFGKFKDNLRHQIDALNEPLAYLLGYGLDVFIKADTTDNKYSLHIKREHPSTHCEGMFEHKCICDAISAKALDVWIPVHNRGAEVQIALRTLNTMWSPPPGFDGYAKFKEEKWLNYAQKRNMSEQSRGWSVESFLPSIGHSGRKRIELVLCPLMFSDIVATTLHLKELLPGEPDDGIRVRNWLAEHHGRNSHVIRSRGLTHFLPAANPLTVDVNVISRDEKIILRRHDEKKKRWDPSISAYVNPLTDVCRGDINLPDPSETAFRECCRSLQIAIPPARVVWLGVGLGLEFGQVSLFGEVRLNQDAHDVVDPTSDNFKSFNINDPATIRAFLETDDAKETRQHCKALLGLSLAGRNPKIPFVTHTRPFESLEQLVCSERIIESRYGKQKRVNRRIAASTGAG